MLLSKLLQVKNIISLMEKKPAWCAGSAEFGVFSSKLTIFFIKFDAMHSQRWRDRYTTMKQMDWRGRNEAAMANARVRTLPLWLCMHSQSFRLEFERPPSRKFITRERFTHARRCGDIYSRAIIHIYAHRSQREKASGVTVINVPSAKAHNLCVAY